MSTFAGATTSHAPQPRGLFAQTRALLESMALQDWIVGTYLVVLTAIATTARGPLGATSLTRMVLLGLVYVAAMVIVRGRLVGVGVGPAILYRIAIYGAVQLSYFWLRDLLASGTTQTFDVALHRIDLAIFPVDPPLWLERFVSPATTEWFAFFYFSYFLVLAVHVLPMLFLCRRADVLADFGLTMLTVYCVAQALYFAVPAFGPHRALAELFSRPLPEGTWMHAVLTTVKAGGAERDAFPSLHTAGPLALALFAFRHRDLTVFRWTWPITAFFALNIMIATVFLRWHYVIDVLAGIALASLTTVFAIHLSRREGLRRAASGQPTVWPSMAG